MISAAASMEKRPHVALKKMLGVAPLRIPADPVHQLAIHVTGLLTTKTAYVVTLHSLITKK